MGEVAILERYPAGRNTMVLISWVMLIVRDALEQDCLWQAPANNATARWRRERQATVHIYNRMHQHLMDIVRACDGIGHLVAMPVPYVYYHLMNVILSLNICLLASIPALIGSWYTVGPFAIAALIIMGLREVACALADPFGEDVTDFPVPEFVNHAFDRAVCLLEATACPGTRERVLEQMKGVEEFSSKSLRRTCKAEVLYDSDKKVGTPAEGLFLWSRSIACAKIKEGTDAAALLYVSLRKRKREGNKMLKQPEQREGEKKTFTFQPGPLGITPNNWELKEPVVQVVAEGSQAQRKGVMPGWKLHELQGHVYSTRPGVPYSKESLDEL